MNWVLICVLILLVFNIINGYRKGLLRIIYSMVSWIIVLVFVTWATPYINNFIMENTAIYENVEAYCEEIVRQKAGEQTELTTDTGLADLGINLPDSVVENILAKTAIATDDFLETSGIYEEISRGLANFVVEGIAFFAALIVARILVHLISQLLGIVSRIPVLKGLNRFLGLFAGGIYGFVIVWIVFYVIALCSASEYGTVLVSYIYESDFLEILYENNPVLTVILYFL